jgi:glycosyltransferase involved in cell wall biosynthesis
MIGLYCPDVPPAPGGVSDHTLMLARAIEALDVPVGVLALRGDPSLFAPIPCRIGLKPGDVADAARKMGITTVVVQYVPFLWARRGVSPAFVLGLRKMKRAGLGIATYIHEPAVPFTRAVWWLTGVPQRLQLAYMIRRCRMVYTAVPEYVRRMRPWAGSRVPIEVAPVGATVPVSRLSRDEARRKLGIAPGRVAIGIFSPAASGFAHPWIARAVQRLASNPEITWVRFGFGSDRPLPGYPTGPTVITLGDAAPALIADTMRALDIAAAPYVDGLTLRRSGAMLALATGIPTVSSEGHLFDPTLAAIAACERNPDAFADRLAQLAADPGARASWAARTAGYADIASMENLARRMVRDLEGQP